MCLAPVSAAGYTVRLRLQQEAFIALLAPPGLQRRPCGHLKHLPYAVLSLGGALHVAKCTDPVGHVPAFLWLNRLLWMRTG